MYGLYFIFTILLLILAVINIPFILYYFYFWLGSVFSTNRQDKTFDEIKTAFSTLSKEEKIALFPFRLCILLGDFLLKFKSATVWIGIVALVLAIISMYFQQLQIMFIYLNWKWFDITILVIGSFGILYLLYKFLKSLYKTDS
jgi:uncharacterized membrane protein